MSTKTKAPAKAKSAAKPPKAKKAADPVVTTSATDASAATTPKDTRNGVTRPKAGTICAGIWDVCDSMKAVGEEITFEALKKALPKVNDATLRTQKQRWRTYVG